MIYTLDTNTCIRAINGRSPSVRQRLTQVPFIDVTVSSIVRSELFYGSAKSQTPIRSRQKQDLFLSSFVTLSFDDQVANTYGTIRVALEKAGTPIGPLDMQIAAIALTYDLILVTHNLREFSRIPSLKLEDWETNI